MRCFVCALDTLAQRVFGRTPQRAGAEIEPVVRTQ